MEDFDVAILNWTCEVSLAYQLYLLAKNVTAINRVTFCVRNQFPICKPILIAEPIRDFSKLFGEK